MGRTWSGRTLSTERASAAWDELVDALNQAGSTARSVKRRTKGFANDASEATGEARRRAKAARDALAGKRAPIPWRWIAGAAAAGMVAALAARMAARRALMGDGRDPLALEDPAAVDIAGPVTLVETAVPAAAHKR